MNFSVTITCIKYVKLDSPYLFTYFWKSERFTVFAKQYEFLAVVQVSKILRALKEKHLELRARRARENKHCHPIF